MRRLLVGDLKKALEGVDDSLPVIVDAKSTDKNLIVEEDWFFHDEQGDVAKFLLLRKKPGEIPKDSNYLYAHDYDVGDTETSLKGRVYIVKDCFSIRN